MRAAGVQPLIDQFDILRREAEGTARHGLPILVAPARLHDTLGRVSRDALEDVGDLMHHHVRQQLASKGIGTDPVPEYQDVNSFIGERVGPAARMVRSWSIGGEFNDDRARFSGAMERRATS